MDVALALISAVLYGAADFAGGFAVRRNGATLDVVFVTQVVGLATVLVYAPIYGASHVTATDLAWGAGAGVWPHRKTSGRPSTW